MRGTQCYFAVAKFIRENSKRVPLVFRRMRETLNADGVSPARLTGSLGAERATDVWPCDELFAWRCASRR
jgi:hypothetical protein